jgi:hypothetical protein
VDFTVDLAEVDYTVLGYNVESVILYRRPEGEMHFARVATIATAASGQTRFQWRWTPNDQDAGKNQFAAFVKTKMPVIELEIASDSIVDVQVRCFSAGQGASRAEGKASLDLVAPQAAACRPPNWAGTASNSVTGAFATASTVTWKLDPNRTGAAGQAFYFAEGSVEVTNTLWNSIGCSVSPTHFTIGQVQGDADSMVVDYGTSPPTYSGTGTIIRNITISCPNEAPLPMASGYTWFSAVGQVSANGTVIEGSSSSPQGGYAYNFQAQ